MADKTHGSEPPHDLNCLSLADLEAIAHNMMDKQTRDYYNEGADASHTLKENTSAYAKYRIRPRVLRDISHLDTTVSVLGQRNSIPIGVASTAMQRLAHPDGELATARACANAHVVMGLSSFSTASLEEVAEESGHNARVLQLYLFEEREHSARLIQRAKQAGYRAVLLTVDTPMLGRRNMEIRNQFRLPKHLKIANFSEETTSDPAASVMSGGTQVGNGDDSSSDEAAAAKADSQPGYTEDGVRHAPVGPITFHTHAPNPTLDWSNSIDWLKKTCGKEMQVWVKGIATAEDARLAIHHGVDGIIVSNHGGRQLDGALATIDALPEVVEVVKGKVPVHVDGGIRHGTDVFKALALGADFVWVGRPALWGLAYKGQAGVEHALRLLSDEFRLCMGLAGTVNVSQITKEYLCKIDSSGFVSKL